MGETSRRVEPLLDDVDVEVSTVRCFRVPRLEGEHRRDEAFPRRREPDDSARAMARLRAAARARADRARPSAPEIPCGTRERGRTFPATSTAGSFDRKAPYLFDETAPRRGVDGSGKSLFPEVEVRKDFGMSTCQAMNFWAAILMTVSRRSGSRALRRRLRRCAPLLTVSADSGERLAPPRAQRGPKRT